MYTFVGNLVPGVFHLPTPKKAREESPCFRLVTRLGDKFMFVGGIPVFQNMVDIGICNIENQPCVSPASLESSYLIAQWNFITSTIIPSAFETGSGNCKKG